MEQSVTNYAVYTEKEFRANSKLIYPVDLRGGMWAKFMQEDPISNKYWSEFHEIYDEFQLYIAEGNRFIARIKSLPIRFDGDLLELPLQGWDWVIENSIDIYHKGIEPNMVSAIEITFLPEYRGQGLSTVALNLMKLNAKRHGFDTLLAPVRPNQKHQFPLIPMQEYITWRRSDGLLYDAWLRVHERAGGEIIRVASESMRIPGTKADWETWTGLDFPATGDYIVPQALNPIHMDIEANQAVYIEPNVWILHRIS